MRLVTRRSTLALYRLLSVALLLLAAGVFVGVLVLEAPSNGFGWDFRYQYFSGAEAIVAGHPLYLSPDDAALEPALEGIRAYVYPPQLAVALVPLTPLPDDVATFLALVASIAALFGALVVLGIRDVRCYAVALLWTPTIGALIVVNLTPFLVLALALAWRFRRSTWPLATALGLAASAKLFLWPMVVWALVIRPRAALQAIVIGIGTTFAAWAAIGFQGLTTYAELVRRLAALHAGNSYSFVGMATALGLDDTVGRVVGIAVGASLLAGCVLSHRRGDEARAFTCAVAASLALSPIVWMHYLLLLIVPLAIARPRFSPIWLLPVLLWVSPKSGYAEGVEVFIPAAAVAILLVAILARPWRAPAVGVPA